MKVYIVKGSAGCYEDYHEWTVYASNNKTKCDCIKINCEAQFQKFYDEMNHMRDEAEAYDSTYIIDDDTPSDQELFMDKRRDELYKILTEDPAACSYEYEYVTYHITEMEVDVV